jgi:hypothetical protein
MKNLDTVRVLNKRNEYKKFYVCVKVRLSSKGRKYIDCIQEEGAVEIIWTWEGVSNSRREKIAW